LNWTATLAFQTVLKKGYWPVLVRENIMRVPADVKKRNTPTPDHAAIRFERNKMKSPWHFRPGNRLRWLESAHFYTINYHPPTLHQYASLVWLNIHRDCVPPKICQPRPQFTDMIKLMRKLVISKWEFYVISATKLWRSAKSHQVTTKCQSQSSTIEKSQVAVISMTNHYLCIYTIKILIISARFSERVAISIVPFIIFESITKKLYLWKCGHADIDMDGSRQTYIPVVMTSLFFTDKMIWQI
jgi:hypothetical protein